MLETRHTIQVSIQTRTLTTITRTTSHASFYQVHEVGAKNDMIYSLEHSALAVQLYVQVRTKKRILRATTAVVVQSLCFRIFNEYLLVERRRQYLEGCVTASLRQRCQCPGQVRFQGLYHQEQQLRASRPEHPFWHACERTVGRARHRGHASRKEECNWKQVSVNIQQHTCWQSHLPRVDSQPGHSITTLATARGFSL